MEADDDAYIYEVKPGDSLYAIAAQFGYVTPTQLAHINHLPFMSSGLPPMFPGQRLIIPSASQQTKCYNKIRHHPGVACRVKSQSDKQDSSERRTPKINDASLGCYIQTQPIHKGSFEDDLEKQFVKVPAQRLLGSEFIDGVLLVTPETLCFDASRTAIAQKQAYLASHVEVNSKQSKSVSEEHSSEFSCCNIPQELLNLGLCVSLALITSMTTLRKAASKHLVSANKHHEVKANTNQKPVINLGPRSASFSTLADSIIDANNLQDNHKTSAAKLFAPMHYSCINSSNSTPNLLAIEYENAESIPDLDNFLYLRITMFENEVYLFQLTVNNLTEVYNFLLRAGVGSSVSKPQHFDKRRNSFKEQTDSPQVSTKVNRPCSFVEEVLESMEQSLPTPLLYGGGSGILNQQMLEELGTNFPAHLIGSNLKLLYKTEEDGYSLNTLYRKCKSVHAEVLLLIRDTTGMVFGAILSDRIQCSQHFYGTGETCVFHWNPNFMRYPWAKKNYFFMRGSSNNFQIGGQSGRNAIWFDESLKYGRSEPTDTFDNPVLSGSLPAFRFHTINPGEPINSPSPEGNEGSETSITNYQTPKSSPLSNKSVPFLIDTLEVWQFVS